MFDRHHPLVVVLTGIIVTLIVSLFTRGEPSPAVAIGDDPLCIVTADVSACKAYWREHLAVKAAAGDDDPLGLFEPPTAQPRALTRP
jgi:hypothetical protein